MIRYLLNICIKYFKIEDRAIDAYLSPFYIVPSFHPSSFEGLASAASRSQQRSRKSACITGRFWGYLARAPLG